MAHPADIVQDAFEEAAHATGAEMVETVRELLSVPVQIITGPRGRPTDLPEPPHGKTGPRAGNVGTIRSVKGENPRRETGALRKSIRSAVEREGDSAMMVLSSDIVYAGYLQELMDRPIFSATPSAPEGLDEEWLPVLVDRTANIISRQH